MIKSYLLIICKIIHRRTKDGGGSISDEELGELMDTLGISASPVNLLFHEVVIR